LDTVNTIIGTETKCFKVEDIVKRIQNTNMRIEKLKLKDIVHPDLLNKDVFASFEVFDALRSKEISSLAVTSLSEEILSILIDNIPFFCPN